jgi:hypothetical protein
VIEAVKFWNEPNNKSHWNFVEYDPEWRIFADLIRRAGQAVASENPWPAARAGRHFAD